MPCAGTSPFILTFTSVVVGNKVTLTTTLSSTIYTSGWQLCLFRWYGKIPVFDKCEKIKCQVIAAGSGTKTVIFEDTPGDGIWYYRVAVECDGVLQNVSNRQSNAIKINFQNLEYTPDDPPPAGHLPHHGIDELYMLVRPYKLPCGLVYYDRRILNPAFQKIQWWYYRNGGCGPFKLLLRENFAESDIALREGWEVHVRIRLSGETDYTTWYRGVIRAVERRYGGNEVLTEIRGQGYVEQLSGVYVNRRYPKGLTVSQIVNDIFDNFVYGQTRIIRPSFVDPTNKDSGVDNASYVTKGPVHFECSALKALKFLAELQGSFEYGVSADREFYFRQKKSALGQGANQHAFFITKDVVDIIDGGREVEKMNKLQVEGKQWGHREILKIAQDANDITLYGLFEKPIETPWVEHDDDAVRWADNIISTRKGFNVWKSIAWNAVDKRLEDNHAASALDMVRVYGKDVSTDFDTLDISKIMYVKGGFVRRAEVKEMDAQVVQKTLDQPVIRAVIYAGIHHKDFVEEMEDKLFDQIAALKAKNKQFRNPNVDVTHPDVSQPFQAGQLFGLYPQDVTDITNTRVKLTYRDVSNRDTGSWVDLVGMRSGDATTPGSGKFPGEEFFVWEDAGRTYGTKFYWTGQNWRKMGT